MIQITRSLARTCWSVLRHCVSRGDRFSRVVLRATGGELRIQLACEDVLAEYILPGNFPTETLAIPVEWLRRMEGKNDDPITVQVDGKMVRASWTHHQMPQFVEEELGVGPPTNQFPPAPKQLLVASSELGEALRTAIAIAPKTAESWAVNRLQLCGYTHTITVTDGRQLLIQRGFEFPWKESLLIAATKMLAHFAGEPSVEIGKTEKHVTISLPPWLFHFPIDTAGRYPKVANLIAACSNGKTVMRLTYADGEFLSQCLSGLPPTDEEGQHLTIDLLDGKVLVRAAGSPATEIQLSHSTFDGPPVRFVVKRDVLTRMLGLGLTELRIDDPGKPMLAEDDNRSYLFVPLSPDLATVSQPNAVHVASGEQRPTPTVERTQPTMPTSPFSGNGNGNGHAQPPTNGHGQPPTSGRYPAPEAEREDDHEGVVPGKSHGMNDLIQEANSLKDELTNALSRCNRLVSAIKRQRKQSKIVQTTLASLRQLQTIG